MMINIGFFICLLEHDELKKNISSKNIGRHYEVFLIFNSKLNLVFVISKSIKIDGLRNIKPKIIVEIRFQDRLLING